MRKKRLSWHHSALWYCSGRQNRHHLVSPKTLPQCTWPRSFLNLWMASSGGASSDLLPLTVHLDSKKTHFNGHWREMGGHYEQFVCQGWPIILRGEEGEKMGTLKFRPFVWGSSEWHTEVKLLRNLQSLFLFKGIKQWQTQKNISHFPPNYHW